MLADEEHKIIELPLPTQRAAEAIPGPWAPVSLLHMTDSRLSDAEKVLLSIISIRSVRHGYTFASWATIATDMGKSVRQVERLASGLIEKGMIRTKIDFALKTDKKWVVPAAEVYGDGQVFGWKLLDANRDALDLKILRSEIPPSVMDDGLTRQECRVGPKKVSGRTVIGVGQRKRNKEKEFKEKEIKDCRLPPGGGPHGDLGSGGGKIRDDNQTLIDDVSRQGQMKKIDESTDLSNNHLGTQVEGTSVVDQQKKLVDERAERLRNLSRQVMAQTDAKSRQKAAKAQEKRRRREEAGEQGPRRSTYQEQKEAAGVVNGGNVRGWWDEVYAETLPGHPNPRWTKQEMVLVNRMLEDFGSDLVEQGVRDFVSNWEMKWSRKYKSDGLPEISMLYFKRSEVLGKIARNDSIVNKKPEPDIF